MDGFLNNEESESSLSCTWNSYWSSPLHPYQIREIPLRIKVTFIFKKKGLTKRLTWDDVQHQTPAHCYFKGWIFKKKKKKKTTLKIRSRSPNYNQLFALSKLYLLRIQPLVHKILCRQEIVMPMQMPAVSAPKSIRPPPLR